VINEEGDLPVPASPRSVGDELLRQMVARPDLGDLAQLIAMTDTGEGLRPQLLGAT
jgi:hypothetical protein